MLVESICENRIVWLFFYYEVCSAVDANLRVFAIAAHYYYLFLFIKINLTTINKSHKKSAHGGELDDDDYFLFIYYGEHSYCRRSSTIKILSKTSLFVISPIMSPRW